MPKVIVLDHATPMRIDQLGAIFTWANSVPPVILIGEAAAGPTKHGNLQLTKRRNHVVTNTACVGDRRVLTNPDAFVDTTPEVFGKVTVDIAIHCHPGRIGSYRQVGLWRFCAGDICLSHAGSRQDEYGADVPAMQVGGDYFDLIPVEGSNSKLFVVVGDVSGKGLSASLYMTKLQTMIKLYCTPGKSPKEILVEVNKRCTMKLNETGL